MNHAAVGREGTASRQLAPPRERTVVNGRRPRGKTDIQTISGPGLIRVLRADYPAVRRLLGDDSFARVAHGFAASDFVTSDFATSGFASAAAHSLSRAFPHYLRTLGQMSSIEYVADVADLEAARVRARHAPDIAPLARQSFASLSAARFGEVTLILHPSVALVTSRFPIVAVWKANCADHDAIIDRWLPQSALIARPHREVEVSVLPAGGYAFMTALADGLPIAEAIKAATAQEQDFDLGANLTMLVEANIVVDIRIVGAARARKARV